MRINNEDQYETSDMPLAASLYVSNATLIGLYKESTKRFVFCFEQSSILQAMVVEYQEDKLLVNPRRFFEAIRYLKSRIYAETA